MASGEELTDEQWLTVESLLPKLPRRSDGRRRPWRSQREVLNGALWICGAVHGGRVCPAPTEAARFASVRRFTLWLSKMAWRGARRARAGRSLAPARAQHGDRLRPGACACAKAGSGWPLCSGAEGRASVPYALQRISCGRTAIMMENRGANVSRHLSIDG